jgi:hypothetical protein
MAHLMLDHTMPVHWPVTILLDLGRASGLRLVWAGWPSNYGDYATKDSAFINLLMNAL